MTPTHAGGISIYHGSTAGAGNVQPHPTCCNTKKWSEGSTPRGYMIYLPILVGAFDGPTQQRSVAFPGVVGVLAHPSRGVHVLRLKLLCTQLNYDNEASPPKTVIEEK